MDKQEDIIKIDIVNKTLKILVYIMVLFLVVIISTNLSIRLDIKNYTKVYGEKINNKFVYYTNDKELVEIKRIKDFYNDKVDPSTIKNVPLFYCNKKDCLYIDLSNKLQRNNLYPKFLILILILVIAILELILFIRKKDENKTKYKAIFLIIVIITAFGLIREAYDISDYYSVVNKNKNFVKGTILGNRGDNRYAIKYELDDKIYYLDSNNKKNTIYYNKTKDKMYNRMNPFNIKILSMYLINILLIAVSLKIYIKKIKENNAQ